MVNTASECGFTPQYQGLQELYDTYADRGVHRARLPLRPVRQPGARRRGGDRGVLRAQLRRHVPDVRQGRRERRRRPPALRVAASEKGGLLGARSSGTSPSSSSAGRPGHQPLRPDHRAGGSSPTTSRRRSPTDAPLPGRQTGLAGNRGADGGWAMAATTSSYSITMRLHTAPDHGVVGAVATAISAGGGIVTAIDVAESQPRPARRRRDLLGERRRPRAAARRGGRRRSRASRSTRSATGRSCCTSAARSRSTPRCR